jgi:hypothetical protein
VLYSFHAGDLVSSSRIARDRMPILQATHSAMRVGWKRAVSMNMRCCVFRSLDECKLRRPDRVHAKISFWLRSAKHSAGYTRHLCGRKSRYGMAATTVTANGGRRGRRGRFDPAPRGDSRTTWNKTLRVLFIPTGVASDGNSTREMRCLEW